MQLSFEFFGPPPQKRSLDEEDVTEAAGADDSVDVVVGYSRHTFKLYR